MEKFITFLLKDNNRIIIPNFGSLIKRPNENNKLSFNEFLKFDDGLLTDYITVKKQLKKEDAKKFIEDFVNKVKEAFNKGDDFSLGNIGSLHKAPNGKIELLSSNVKEVTVEKQNTKKDAIKKKEKIELKSEETDKTNVKAETPKPSESKDIDKKESSSLLNKSTKKKETSENVKDDTVTKTTSENNTENTDNKVANTSEKVILKTTKKEPEKTTSTKTTAITKNEETTISKQQKTEEATTPTKTMMSKSDIVTENKKIEVTDNFQRGSTSSTEDNSKKMLIIIIAAVFVIALLVSGFIFRKNIAPGLFNKDKTQITQTKKSVKQNTKKIDSNKKATTVKNNKSGTSAIKPKNEVNKKVAVSKKLSPKVNTTSTTVNVHQYYIVAGCFKDKWRADKYIATLQKEGFPNSNEFAMIGSFHAICYEGYNTKQQALSELQKIREEKQMKGWIRYH